MLPRPLSQMGRGISIPPPLEGYGVSYLSQLINYYLARERKFQGTKVPGSESSWNFRSRERKFLGAKVPVTIQCSLWGTTEVWGTTLFKVINSRPTVCCTVMHKFHGRHIRYGARQSKAHKVSPCVVTGDWQGLIEIREISSPGQLRSGRWEIGAEIRELPWNTGYLATLSLSM